MIIANSVTRSFEKNISFGKEGIYIIPRAVFYYAVNNNTVKAYSNELTISIVDSKKPLLIGIKKEDIPGKKEIRTDAVKPDEASKDKEMPKEKKGFFQNVFAWLKSLFIKEETVVKKTK
jgi:hypothetical protein